MDWRSRADEHKGEAALGITAIILIVALIVTCARAERREEDLLERLCALGDESACQELENAADFKAEGGRERP